MLSAQAAAERLWSLLSGVPLQDEQLRRGEVDRLIGDDDP